MAEIAILLATYNGERYLAQQIDSIISQTYKDWILYIRDDGSTDSTINIVEEYENNNLNIVILTDSKKHLGAMNSFIWMMKKIDSEFYMFCDQDDIWLPNKIEISYIELLSLKSKSPNIPLLIFTDLFVVDESLKIISSSMWEYSRSNRVMNPKYLLAGPFATGCTMLFNNKAKQCSLKYINKATMHDALLALSVSQDGGIIKGIPCSLIFYRQHSCNTLGVSKFNTSIIYRFSNIINIIRINYQYFKFVNSITNISFAKFIRLKVEAALKIRNII